MDHHWPRPLWWGPRDQPPWWHSCQSWTRGSQWLSCTAACQATGWAEPVSSLEVWLFIRKSGRENIGGKKKNRVRQIWGNGDTRSRHVYKSDQRSTYLYQSQIRVKMGIQGIIPAKEGGLVWATALNKFQTVTEKVAFKKVTTKKLDSNYSSSTF